MVKPINCSVLKTGINRQNQSVPQIVEKKHNDQRAAPLLFYFDQKVYFWTGIRVYFYNHLFFYKTGIY